jgi:hypothetical protein
MPSIGGVLVHLICAQIFEWGCALVLYELSLVAQLVCGLLTGMFSRI